MFCFEKEKILYGSSFANSKVDQRKLVISWERTGIIVAKIFHVPIILWPKKDGVS